MRQTPRFFLVWLVTSTVLLAGAAQVEAGCITPRGAAPDTAVECTFENAVGRAWKEGETRLLAILDDPSVAAQRQTFYEISKAMVRYQANLVTGEVELILADKIEKGHINDPGKVDLESTVKALYATWRTVTGATPGATAAGEYAASCIKNAEGLVATLLCFYHPDM